MEEQGTLYAENNYEKIKQIHKNIYLSPLDFGDLYFEIGKRLEVANQIRQDLRLIIEENQLENQQRVSGERKRIKFSRIQTDLNHFRMNCQIPGIYEIDKVIQQIATSRKTIEEVKAILLSEANFPADDHSKQAESLARARTVQSLIEIDMECEELEIRKLMFTKNFALLQKEHIKIDVEQFYQLEKEYRQHIRQ